MTAGSTLSDEVIRNHAGDSRTEAEAYRRLDPALRVRLLNYLGSLVLYPTDQIPCDIDGDSMVRRAFEVGGQDVGFERFDARFLFKNPPRFERLLDVTNSQGKRFPLMLLKDIQTAYGADLPFRLDSDGDGFPNAIDPKPMQPGVTDDGLP